MLLYILPMPEELPIADVVGVGLNATDTLVRLPNFPSFDQKMRVLSSERRAGGQVASAMVACRRWGLSARYVGKVGDDEAARFQREELERDGVEHHLISVPNCTSQLAFILVDHSSGERTILWERDDRLELRVEELRREWVTRARALHVDGHDASAGAAARWAREASIPVTADLDNVYAGIEVLLENVDYALVSRDFPARLLGVRNLLQSLPMLADRFGCKVTAGTLGREGVLAYCRELPAPGFLYVPGYEVRAVDTTGAGDIFHAAFLYGLLQGWELRRNLEFSCAAAALNSTAVGARGGIKPVAEIEALRTSGRRNPAAYKEADLAGARPAMGRAP